MTKEYIIPETDLRRQALRENISNLDVGAGVIRDNRLLLVRREINDFMGGVYELPGGGVVLGETLEETLRREVQEETKLTIRSIIGSMLGFDYELKDGNKVRQFNFLVEVEEGEIELNPQEHDGYVWLSQENLEKIPLTSEMQKVLKNYFCFR